MITEITSQCPFDIPGLFWREGRFSISDATTMSTSADPLGRLEIVLPAALMNAVPKRRSEFLAGRICAGLALRAAGQSVHVARNGRAPVWPPGVAGSISHSDGWAIAAVSLTHSAIGVDCETIMTDALAHKLHNEIISDAEALFCPDTMPFANFLTIVFSAKEAVYKALYGKLDIMPAFLAAELVGLTAHAMSLEMQGKNVQVHYHSNPTECITVVALP